MAKKKKKLPPLTLANLEKWLKSQDPTTEYAYGDISDCLMARFARALGYDVAHATPDVIWLKDLTAIPLPPVLDQVARYPEAYRLARTYGGALEALLRAKKA